MNETSDSVPALQKRHREREEEEPPSPFVELDIVQHCRLSSLSALPLLAVDGRIDCQGPGKLKSLSALIICVGLGALTKQATQIHMMPLPE